LGPKSEGKIVSKRLRRGTFEREVEVPVVVVETVASGRETTEEEREDGRVDWMEVGEAEREVDGEWPVTEEVRDDGSVGSADPGSMALSGVIVRAVPPTKLLERLWRPGRLEAGLVGGAMSRHKSVRVTVPDVCAPVAVEIAEGGAFLLMPPLLSWCRAGWAPELAELGLTGKVYCIPFIELEPPEVPPVPLVKLVE
jgi:hypothetical protein